jgi:hypothetical protein
MKKIKNIVFLLITFALVFVGAVKANAATVVNKDGFVLSGQQFLYDYTLQFVLNPTLQNGNTVVINTKFKAPDGTYASVIEDEHTRVMARWYNLKDVHYTPEGGTELTGKALYDYIMDIQDDIDSEISQGTAYYSVADPSLTSPAVEAWNRLMNTNATVVIDGNDLNALYCYLDEFYDTIELPTDCEDQYYIVIAVYKGTEGIGNEITTARAYKVNADQTKCPVCTTENGKYYDDEGKEVTEAQYKKACFSCKAENGKFYNKAGEEVTEAQYSKDCHSCKIENGKFYDKDGKEVTEDAYNKSCRSCLTENGKYYNKVGKEVTKAEYEKDCGNPGTGVNNPYLFVAIIVAAGAAIALVSRNKKYV